ncbi:uncharacterized protein LOC142173681 [Nicotiana tabacum]|uniref:Uncharacterized protein LOC142173681 n=1 Tax=Nicotiana tabacum TaxID=4097 RepID=A0AC58TDX0_TOBAC
MASDSSPTDDIKPFFTSISNPSTITTVRLQGSDNYTPWSSLVEMWFMGQGYEDHLVKSASDIDTSERTKWTRIDAQLCNLIWNSLDPKLLKLFQSCKTCYKDNQDMTSYLGQMDTLKEYFDSLMPLSTNITMQEQERDKFFMILALKGLRSDLSSIHRDKMSIKGGKVKALDLTAIIATSPVILDKLVGNSTVDQHVLTITVLLMFSPISPWILDSGTFDYISGNQNLFSNFTHSSTFSADRSIGKMIETEYESQRLYYLSKSQPLVAFTSAALADLLHNRLGHLSLAKFQKLIHSFSTLSSIECEYCQLRKHTRTSFPKRVNNRASSMFDIVHSDVWGPSRVVSSLGFQYFVTFIDDFSRCIWVLRSDNSKEYLSSPFDNSMSSQGITHQTSCAYTPQQNGVAECQNLYHLPLKAFGCTCSVHDHSPGNDKLQPKSIKCVFRGYSRYQKGQSSNNPEVAPPSLQVYSRRARLPAHFNSTTPDPDTVTIPKTVDEALEHPGWRGAMIEEMIALETNNIGNWSSYRRKNLLLDVDGYT